MAMLKKILKNGWVKAVVAPLIVFFFTDVVFKQNLLAKGWSSIKEITSPKIITNVWVILLIILSIILILFLIFWIRRRYFHKDWNTKIGNYTFKQLYSIMKTEHIHDEPHPLRQLRQGDFSQFSILELFIAHHQVLSSGVDLEGDLFLYHSVCPRLHLYGLLDKADTKYNNPDYVLHHYTINDSGKNFWATLNKLSIKARLENERKKLRELKLKANQ